MSLYHFPANRPFFGWHGIHSLRFDSLGKLEEDTNRFITGAWIINGQGDGFDFIESRVFHPPPTIIRYWNEYFSSLQSKSHADANEIEVGRNWQTLLAANHIFANIGLRNPPQSYDELTDNHFALVIFQNKLHRGLPGSENILSTPSDLQALLGTSTSSNAGSPTPLFARNMMSATRHQHIFSQLDEMIVHAASVHVWLESFFSESSIKTIVNEIASLVGPDLDKDFLHKTITEFGNKQKEMFDASLRESFEWLAPKEAELTYQLFVPGYNIADSQNFQEYKQALIQLMEGMYEKAVSLFLAGDVDRTSDSLWDSMWTDDRIFNIGGQRFTMREMDDRRTFLITGSHRQSDNSEFAAVKDNDEEAKYQDSPLALKDRLSALFAKRFASNHRQNVETALLAYEKFFGRQ